MKVELDSDEVWAILSTVTKHVLDETELNDDDRAALRRWRSQQMRQGTDAMKALVQKVNDDMLRLQRMHERSAIQKHDWV
jgi:hypothetical protein